MLESNSTVGDVYLMRAVTTGPTSKLAAGAAQPVTWQAAGSPQLGPGDGAILDILRSLPSCPSPNLIPYDKNEVNLVPILC